MIKCIIATQMDELFEPPYEDPYWADGVINYSTPKYFHDEEELDNYLTQYEESEPHLNIWEEDIEEI